MCLHPLKIKNTTKNFCPDTSPAEILVPCGECSECISSYRRQWQSRMQTEIKDTYERGGKSFMLLLTYSENKIPTFKLRDYENPQGAEVTLYGFNHDHIKRFRRDIIDQLHNYYSIPYGSVSYLCACEYGENPNKTHRSHYHFLLNIKVPNRLTEVNIRELCNRIWHCAKTNNESNKGSLVGMNNGLANPYRKINGRTEIPQLEVKSPYSGSKYLSKYLSKSMDFYSQPHLQAFMRVLKKYRFLCLKNLDDCQVSRETFDETCKLIRASRGENFSPFLENGDHRRIDKLPDTCFMIYFRLYAKLCRIRKFFPKHWQSNGFGSALLETLAQKKNDKEMVDYLITGYPTVDSRGNGCVISISSYVRNKFFFTTKEMPYGLVRVLKNDRFNVYVMYLHAQWKINFETLRAFLDKHYVEKLTCNIKEEGIDLMLNEYKKMNLNELSISALVNYQMFLSGCFYTGPISPDPYRHSIDDLIFRYAASKRSDRVSPFSYGVDHYVFSSPYDLMSSDPDRRSYRFNTYEVAFPELAFLSKFFNKLVSYRYEKERLKKRQLEGSVKRLQSYISINF